MFIVSYIGIVSCKVAAGYPSCSFTLCPSMEFWPRSVMFSSRIPIRWRHTNVHRFIFHDFLGIGCSWLPYLQRHHYVLQRVFRRPSGVLCQITNSMAIKQLSFFHISRLVRDWIQLTTLPPPSLLRTSTGVSISVGDSFVKVTNLMSAQDLLRQTLLVCMLDN